MNLKNLNFYYKKIKLLSLNISNYPNISNCIYNMFSNKNKEELIYSIFI